jgi:hypothetical protein
MNLNDILMHYRAARESGRELACGNKQVHGTEEQADRHAAALNKRPEVQLEMHHRVESYPCPWCCYWHVGREMTWGERVQWTNASDYQVRNSRGII